MKTWYQKECDNNHSIREDILEEKVVTEINIFNKRKIKRLNRKNIYDLINMIYLNEDGLIKIEFKMRWGKKC